MRSNILVRSMGPFSEHRMDFSMDCYFRQVKRKIAKKIFKFEEFRFEKIAVVAGSAPEFQRPNRDAQFEHQDAGRNLEAGHVFLQRKEILSAHHHDAQQTLAHQ